MLGRLLLTLLLAAALGAPSANAQPLSRADRAFVDATVEKAIAADGLPGVSIEISGPRGSYARAYGTADRSAGTPMSLDDRVRIASGAAAARPWSSESAKPRSQPSSASPGNR